ncbi:MAG: MFS transporter [candidate division NC10 bacterium]|nr:MFS transporter [candidate division NC10 bacterium]
MRSQGVGLPKARLHYAWVVTGVTCLALLAVAGVRSSFGVFVQPLQHEFGWDRAAISVTAVLSMLLYGALGPLAGKLADRYGPKYVLLASILLAGIGALASSTMSRLWQFHLYYGLITSIGAGGAAMVTAAAMVSRWFAERRALIMGLAGAGVSAGQLLILPLAAYLELSYGWRWSFAGMGLILVVLVLPVVGLLFRNDPAEMGLASYGARSPRQTASATAESMKTTSLMVATRHPSFWLLAGSFFVCGYTSTGLIGVHLIPHAVDHGFPKMVASSAMGLMGAMNVIGTTASGYICDRYGKRIPLAMYYFLRGLSLFFLLGVRDVTELNLFAILFGLNYISTVPPTSTLTADLFGRRSVGMLFGWIFFSHQIGAALASYVGGRVYDVTGTYDWAFISAGILGILAAGMVLAIPEQPRRPAPEAAPTGSSPRAVPATAD